MIALVALMVFGPSKLPEIARTIKRGIQEWNKVKGQVADTISDLKHEIDLKAQVEEQLKPIFSPANKVSPRKATTEKTAGQLPGDPVSSPPTLDVPQHDDYLTPSPDGLSPAEDAVGAGADDYLEDAQ